MAIGYSHVALIGNLGKNPQLIEGHKGTLRASFTLAVDRISAEGSEERRERTDWFPIVAWGRVAETCRDRLTKGSWVFILGRLQVQHWQDEKGDRHHITEVVAQEVILLDGPEADAEGQEPS